jgi:hypothetical protein
LGGLLGLLADEIRKAFAASSDVLIGQIETLRLNPSIVQEEDWQQWERIVYEKTHQRVAVKTKQPKQSCNTVSTDRS